MGSIYQHNLFYSMLIDVMSPILRLFIIRVFGGARGCERGVWISAWGVVVFDIAWFLVCLYIFDM